MRLRCYVGKRAAKDRRMPAIPGSAMASGRGPVEPHDVLALPRRRGRIGVAGLEEVAQVEVGVAPGTGVDVDVGQFVTVAERAGPAGRSPRPPHVRRRPTAAPRRRCDRRAGPRSPAACGGAGRSRGARRCRAEAVMCTRSASSSNGCARWATSAAKRSMLTRSRSSTGMRAATAAFTWCSSSSSSGRPSGGVTAGDGTRQDGSPEFHSRWEAVALGARVFVGDGRKLWGESAFPVGGP